MVYCKYSRDERKKLHKFRAALYPNLWKDKFTEWNNVFKEASPEAQDAIWNEYFPPKEVTMNDLPYNSYSSLGHLTEVEKAPEAPYPWCKPVKKEKESAMGYQTAACSTAINVSTTPVKTEDQDKKDYLFDRLCSIAWEKRDEEKKPYGLVDDDAPKTIKERKERFAAGKFVINWRADEDDYEDDEEFESSYSAGGNIRWRDPAVKEDRKGYEAAMEKMGKDLTDFRDIIKIKSPDEGLTAVKDFEKRTYH